MNILFIVPYMPNLVRARSYNLIRSLVSRGNHLTLLTLWTSESERAEVPSLEEAGVRVHALPQPTWRSLWNCLVALPGSTPLQAVFSWNPALAALSARLVECNGDHPIDVIHVEHLRGARFGLKLKSRFSQIPVVWDSVDCISYLFEQAAGQSRSRFGRLITRLDLQRTKRYEGLLPGRFDHVLITSAVDRQALLSLIPDHNRAAPISILPNGVDWEYFAEELVIDREPATLVLSGKMSYHANVTMALYLMDEIMPRVWNERPDVRVLIVGKDPPASIRAFGEDPRVEVTGTVDDIRPYLRRASIAVVPLLYGAGSQFKVLEAMACATPVVATPRAVLALQAQPEQDILLAETPEGFAGQILKLLEHPELREQIARAGRRYVREHHQWAKIAERLEGVYHEVISTGGKRSIQ